MAIKANSVVTAATVATSKAVLSLSKFIPGAQKEWVAIMDAATRPTHAEANGQIVPAYDAFSVGGYSMEYPGDTVAPIGETANCRCVLQMIQVDRETEEEPLSTASTVPVKPLSAIDSTEGIDIEAAQLASAHDPLGWKDYAGTKWEDAQEVLLTRNVQAHESLMEYIGKGYSEINGDLRVGVKSELTRGMDVAFKKAALEAPANTRLFRGITENAGAFSPEKLTVGQVLAEPGYVSTSFRYGRAESFRRGKGWVTEIRSSKPLKYLPGEKSEAELILNRDTVFKILSINKVNRTLVMEVV